MTLWVQMTGFYTVLLGYQRAPNITSLHEVTLPQLWYIIIGTYKLPSDNTFTKEKNTMSMAMFSNYVKLPEGTFQHPVNQHTS